MIAGQATGAAAIAAAGPLPRLPAGQARAGREGAAAPQRDEAARVAGENSAAEAPRP